MDETLIAESQAFDRQTESRIKNGFIPDLRRLNKVEWFTNNVWREPEFAEIHWLPRIQQIVADAARYGEHARVLEVGCGYGLLALELARAKLQVTAIDLSPRSIECAQDVLKSADKGPHFGSLNYLCGDFLSMTAESEGYDAVVFFRSLHHMPDLEATVAKTHALLKPGGALILSEPVRAHFTQQSAAIAGIVRLLADTWQDAPSKLAQSEDIDRYFQDVFSEYTFDEHHEQSPLDNSNDNGEHIKAALSKHFHIQRSQYSDAFIDKVIGGLRGEQRFAWAQRLKQVDDYLVRTGLLHGTSLELLALKAPTLSGSPHE